MVEVRRLRAAGQPTVPEDMEKPSQGSGVAAEIVGRVASLICFGILPMAERRRGCGWRKQDFQWVEFVLGRSEW